jgi:hypothetical protein
MSDRCYLTVTVEASKAELFKRIVFGGEGVEVDSRTDLAVTFVDYEANYALYEELVEAAQNQILFHGYHGNGDEYSAGYFFSKGSSYQSWTVCTNNDGFCVLVDENGTIPQEEQDKLRVFVQGLHDVKKRLSDSLYALIAELT